MTTCNDLIGITRDRYLLGGAGEKRNRLAANYSPGGGTLTFLYDPLGVTAGGTLSIGLNTFYVYAVDKGSRTATVEGGYQGSTDVAANTGDTVVASPRYPDFQIFTALNEELLALSSAGVGLYQMKQTQFAFNSSRIGYDLPGVTDIIQVHSVRYAQTDSFQRTPNFPPGSWSLERNYLVGENSSTFSLKLFQGAQPGQSVTVLYRAPFTPFTSVGQDVSVTGVPTSALDLPPMGAALRLGVGREIRRNDITSQGDTRRAEEVGPGAAAASWRGLMGLRMTRIQEEVAALAAKYPERT